MARKSIVDGGCDKESLGKNPFLVYLHIYAIKVSNKKELFEKDEDVVVSTDNKANIVTSCIYDVDHYTKVFNSATNRLKYMSLSSSSLKLLRFIECEVKAAGQYVVINIQRFLKESGFSNTTYRKSVIELIKGELIAPTSVSNIFYINPDFFFNGNRIKAFPDNIVLIEKQKQNNG